MDNRRIVAMLNRLLHAEVGNLLPRLAESNLYSAWTSAVDHTLIERMTRECRNHQSDLAQMILTLRGTPETSRFPMEFGAFHYLDLSYLMPQMLASVRGLIGEYESTAGLGHPEADALIARHLSDHRRHLVELEKLHANLGGLSAVR